MNTLKMEQQILDNNKLARMIAAMAKANINSTERIDSVLSYLYDIVLDPREVSDMEEAVRFQSSMLLDMLVLYNEYTAEHTQIMSAVEEIRNSDEMQTIIGEPNQDIFTTSLKFNEFVENESEEFTK